MLILCATAPIAGSVVADASEMILEGEFSQGCMSIVICGDDPAAAGSLLPDLDCSSRHGWAAIWKIDRFEAGGFVMLVHGRVHSWSPYRHYLAGLRKERLLENSGATPIFFGPPAEVLRGDRHPDDVSVAIRFPSLDAVCGFWQSDSYADVRARRTGAADLNVGVWRSR